MRKAMIVTLGLLPFLSRITFGQAPETTPKTFYGYAFFTPGVLVGEGTSPTINIGGGGEGLIKGGLGASVDLSYLFFPRRGLGDGLGCSRLEWSISSGLIAKPFPSSLADIHWHFCKEPRISCMGEAALITGSVTDGDCVSKYGINSLRGIPNTTCCSFASGSSFVE